MTFDTQAFALGLDKLVKECGGVMMCPPEFAFCTSREHIVRCPPVINGEYDLRRGDLETRKEISVSFDIQITTVHSLKQEHTGEKR
jgi:hypothetical protein